MDFKDRLFRGTRGLLVAGLLLPTGCQQMSEKVTDESVGLNGGFEVSRNGLPVNWLMYTPNTVEDAEFTISLDQDVVQEGKQSLKFDVVRSSSRGGRRAPGFTNEFFETGRFRGPATYRLSFWVHNAGVLYQVMAGGVAAKTGDMQVLVKDDSPTDDWKQLQYDVDVPEGDWLRMELNILGPGTFWIDNVEINKIG